MGIDLNQWEKNIIVELLTVAADFYANNKNNDRIGKSTKAKMYRNLRAKFIKSQEIRNKIMAFEIKNMENRKKENK